MEVWNGTTCGSCFCVHAFYFIVPTVLRTCENSSQPNSSKAVTTTPILLPHSEYNSMTLVFCVQVQTEVLDSQCFKEATSAPQKQKRSIMCMYFTVEHLCIHCLILMLTKLFMGRYLFPFYRCVDRVVAQPLVKIWTTRQIHSFCLKFLFLSIILDSNTKHYRIDSSQHEVDFQRGRVCAHVCFKITF